MTYAMALAGDTLQPVAPGILPAMMPLFDKGLTLDPSTARETLLTLAPAFDINPFPDRERESKTWLSEEDGPITDVHMLMARAPWFSLNDEQALQILHEVHRAVSQYAAANGLYR